MDEILNCVLEVCCGPEKAEEALAAYYVKYGGLDEKNAKRAAVCTRAHFDVAEKGTLQPLKDSIARLARGADYKP